MNPSTHPPNAGDYHPPQNWSKIDAWTAKAEDGSRAGLDIRGLVGITKPDGTYISFGADLAETGGALYNKNYQPPPSGSRIRVFTQASLDWYRDGRRTGHALPPHRCEAFLQSLSRALAAMGYAAEFVDVPS